MFPVEIWGNVAEWIGGGGTAGAAVWAAYTYREDSKNRRQGQARLVRAHFNNGPGGDLTISVINDSDRPITVDYIDWRVMTFERGLMDDLSMDVRLVPIESTEGDEPEYKTFLVDDVFKTVDSKTDIYGFDAPGAPIGGASYLSLHDARRVAPGVELKIKASQTVGRRQNIVFFLVFIDANGIGWGRRIGDKSTELGELCERKDLRSRMHKLTGVERTRRRELKVRIRSIRWRIGRYAEKRYWLFKHRKETTSPYPMAEAAGAWVRVFTVHAPDRAAGPGGEPPRQ